MKQAIREALRRAHAGLGLGALPEALAVYFHSLEQRDWNAFADAAAHFEGLGYRTVTPWQYVEPDAPGRRLFVSFDDNFHSWYRALDLLGGLGITATFYVNSAPFRDLAPPSAIAAYFARIGHAGEAVSLTRAELRTIHAAGHTIGCHTHSHPVLSDLAPAAWRAEIVDAKRALEDVIGAPVTDFAYPFGMRRHFSADLRQYCVGVGFRTIATAIGGLQYETPIDPLAIHRTGWKLDASLDRNLADLRVDGRLYARLTGRSIVG